MENYKKEFIEFMLESGVLKFGEFKTKSGRLSPYFINTGNYKNGMQFSKLGNYYAECFNENIKEEVDAIFGPAYKGISLSVALSMSLYSKYNKNINFGFNRKEVKDHGEGGNLIGYVPKDNDNIMIIEDVVTAGTSVRESIELLNKIAKVNIFAQIISVDRMELGMNGKTAIKELEEEFGIKTYPIVTIKEIIEHLHNKEINGKIYIDDEIYSKIKEYMKNYCE